MPVGDLRAGHRSGVRCECEQRTSSVHVPLRDPRCDGMIASGAGREEPQVLGPEERQLLGEAGGLPGLQEALRENRPPRPIPRVPGE